jgi:hypothetical protein
MMTWDDIMTCAQDALHFWARNKNEEGGGGYLAWNWDSSIWGADVMLATLAGATDATYAAEVGMLCSAVPLSTACALPRCMHCWRGGDCWVGAWKVANSSGDASFDQAPCCRGCLHRMKAPWPLAAGCRLY